MSCEIAGFEIRDMINWNYTQSMPKGMSMNHIIQKMKISEEEKAKLMEEYNDVYDKNFLVSKPGKKEKGEGNSHITVKPVALMEHLVQLFSKKGSLVVDPFLGSGTTALACKNTGRKCIGIELNKEYYEIALARCKCEVEVDL
jgi:site-specific DNA-methyltransferase (adenine-specific)